MNLILLEPSDFLTPETVELRGRRVLHMTTVHHVQLEQSVRVGLLNGEMGTGRVTEIGADYLKMNVTLNQAPPQPIELKLFLALPRPKYLSRCVQTATSLGVKQIYLFNSYRVEKAYWSCDQIRPEKLHESMLLGLEQARDTMVPQIHLKKLFKPFVEDEVPDLIQNTRALVAHPSAHEACPFQASDPVSLAIGPEGGFIEYEIKKLQEAGFTPVHTMERILKVETALASLIGRLK
jgi:16S rRNA (uracil1498-N3)-methyltransferase